MSFNRRDLLAGLIVCPLCAQAARADSAPRWAYEGAGGPAEWGGLDAAFKVCATGAQQSPVDLGDTVRAEIRPVAPSWQPQVFTVVNTSRTIQVNATASTNTLTLEERTYELKQFHFHTPSEHAVAGVHAAMEAHFVHARPDGMIAVIGVFMTAGKKNDAFAAVMAAAPKTMGSATPQGEIDISAFLPSERALYRYEGSLTTPPCSEVVDWNIYATPIEVAQADIDAFRAVFPQNARPLQAVNRRFLLRLN